MAIKQTEIVKHVKTLKKCKKCPDMTGPVVTGTPVISPLLLVGQAPGDREGALGRPFAWTAGKTMFKWFESIGIDEEHFRERVYMAAVCRCFPGKNPKGGDRVPSSQEIENCSGWLNREITLLEPQLIVPVGKLAISQFMETKKLVDVIGTMHTVYRNNISTDIIPLPHPSGASTWHRREPGITLLHKALQLIRDHPAWHKLQNR